MTKVVVMNGPVGCGKDRASSMLGAYLFKEGVNALPCRFKVPLYSLACLIYQVDREWFYQTHEDRVTKEVCQERLGGKSTRQVLIEVSEEVIKPFYGSSYFGDYAVNYLKSRNWPVSIFSDSGFEEELEPVSNYVGKENVILCRIRNRGSFSNDSRSFLSDKHAGTVLDYDNSGSLDELHKWVESVGDMILKEFEIDATGC